MKITVLGATGCVGSATAFQIAAAGLADELVLVGRRKNVAEHHAMDLAMAAAKQDVKVWAGDYEDIAGSDIVVNAAGTHHGQTGDPDGRLETLRDNVRLMRRIGQEVQRLCPRAVVLTASNPVDLLNYALWKASGLPRRQVIGYSLNDSIRFGLFVGEVKRVRPSQVVGLVIGEHGPTQVPLFSSVRVGGHAISFTDEEKRQVVAASPRFFQRFEALQARRTAGWTCAVGLAAMVEAVARDAQELMPGSVVLEGEYGCQGLSIGVPLRLGWGGFSEIVELPLATDERDAFLTSVMKVREGIRIVDDELARVAADG